MVDRIASTSSTAFDVEFDEHFIQEAAHLPVEKLMEELAMLQADNHPLLYTMLRKIEKDRKLQEDRIRCHRERAELNAQQELKEKEEELRVEYDSRIAELQEEAKKRSEELDRSVIHEYGTVDINKPMAIPLVFESNKKTLRGRGGGQLVEPATYFNMNQGNKLPEITYKLAFDDARIRRDLDLMLNRTPDVRRKAVYTVSIQKPRLIIDNKAFKHGEDVYAQNSTFGEMLAKIEIVNDTMIHFKGVKTWDTRQISATLEDLEEGRVTIAKQRGKEKGGV